MPHVLIITGDSGESYEALYTVHRFEEEGWTSAVAAPSSRRLNLVMHDFKPGWDTYIERRGYGLEAGLAFDDVKVEDYAAVLVLGGRAPEYLRNNKKLRRSFRSSIGRRNGFSPSVIACRSSRRPAWRAAKR